MQVFQKKLHISIKRVQVQNYLNTLYFNWKTILSGNTVRYQVITIAFLYVFLFKFCRIIMATFEARAGFQLVDPILTLIPAYDCSVITFALTYMTLGIFLFTTFIDPRTFIIGFQGYCLLIIMRTISIYLVPLEPPAGMILLKDPVSNFFLRHPDGGYIVKDLFFSGHVSTIVLFFFVSNIKPVKQALLVLAIAVSALLLIQHVHYTIDILAAPFFAFLAYKGSLYFNKVIANIKNPVLTPVN